ncbi:head GIN domain-containing protein [uncultured Maribacter sp.]|uniref:head GIN domain-containing protein n=1 Tax=uncultured Maribacter sp. TaxID=431308 RepID=UPI00261FA460|nr:head GIN domain-containing protein [uncultured Maribacter sp.]
MTTLVKITIAIILTLLLSSCGFDINFGDFGSGVKGNKVVVEEDRKVTDDFTVISASEGIQVYVTQAEEYHISVKADENVIDLIGTDIANGKLRIHAIENIGRSTKKVYVSLPNINALKSSSGSHLTAENIIKSNDLEIDASSGSILSAQISCKELEVDASSGANISLSGKANNADVDSSSGANIRAKNLNTLVCSAEASSGSNIKIHVSESLHADASSGANISYSGEANVQKKKSVSGSVHKF